LSILQFKAVSKTFSSVTEHIQVLDAIDLSIAPGDFVAIMGPSGSGKSTLLGIAAGLDQPTQGKVILDGIDLSIANEKALAELRRDRIGFVFQNFQLLPGFTALENVALPLFLKSEHSETQILEKAREYLRKVGMEHRQSHFPRQLSGGEEQRIAIARSFVNEPRILFADEPTANLDSKNSQIVLELLETKNKESRTTLVLVTHDPDVAKRATRIIQIKDGKILPEFEEKKKEIKPNSKRTKR